MCIVVSEHAIGCQLHRDEHKDQVPQQVWLHGMYRGHIMPVPALIPEEHQRALDGDECRLPT